MGDDDEDSTTLVESVEDGWWYTSPLPAGRRIAAFLTDGDLLPTREQWPVALQRTRHVSAAVSGGVLRGPLRTSPAETSHLDRLHGPGWLAVGDAACAWDPLSSQGIVTAILMGGRAAEVIAGARDVGEWERDYRTLLREHCAERADFARVERRWPDSPFWSRRQSEPVSADRVE
jgi:hypothetical protein